MEVDERQDERNKEVDQIANDSELDDDGKPKRTGTTWTSIAHIITAVIGADCYRTPDPVTGERNHTYMEAVKNILGGRMHMVCGIVQYANLSGAAIGYTITTSVSAVSIRKINCFQRWGTEYPCHYSNNPYMIGLGIVEIFLSQIPNFHKLSWLSIVAATTSFGYAFIGIGLSLATIIQGKGKSTYLIGGKEQYSGDKLWNMLIALGNGALARYSGFIKVIATRK
ncbi:hypothetical protein P8452_00820 [Trifolium repens]|nr:hypothetical protein P8452_00820 [Trifolium repens]